MSATPPAGVSRHCWQEIGATLLSLAGGQGQGREDIIAANIERLVDEPGRQSERFYGLWGLLHVIQAQVSGESPMALRLARPGGALAGKVGSVLMIPLNSRMMLPSAALAEADRGPGAYTSVPYTMDDEAAVLLNGIQAVSAVATERASLVRLDGPRSPYRGSDLLTRASGFYARMQPFEIDPSTAPSGVVMNYVALVRDSLETRPYEPAHP